jgi:SAM-dependent methyltransferase
VILDDLPPEAFRRYDESPDPLFYTQPRLVTHIDDAALGAVTQLYRDLFPPGGAILDLMSSWVSHLPEDVAYRRVVGLGLNQEELDANPRLDARIVRDLNREPRLPFDDGEFDGAAICVSIQYLTQPVTVLRDVGRVLRPGAPLVVTFSNRCFPTKAVAIWQALDDAGHGRLVEHYLRGAGNWADIEALDRSPNRHRSDPLYAVVGRSHPDGRSDREQTLG